MNGRNYDHDLEATLVVEATQRTRRSVSIDVDGDTDVTLKHLRALVEAASDLPEEATVQVRNGHVWYTPYEMRVEHAMTEEIGESTDAVEVSA